MQLEIANIFSKHLKNSRYEDLDNETINKIKVFLLDSLGVGIAGSTGAKLSELKNKIVLYRYGGCCSTRGLYRISRTH